MEWKIFGTAFLTLFLAELGDKTQLAVITMTASATSTQSKILVFAGAALALVAVTLLGVLFGAALTQVIPAEWLRRIAAGAFIVIGVLMLVKVV